MSEAAKQLADAMLAMAKEMRALRIDVQDLRKEAKKFNDIMTQVRQTEGASAMVAHLLRSFAKGIG